MQRCNRHQIIDPPLSVIVQGDGIGLQTPKSWLSRTFDNLVMELHNLASIIMICIPIGWKFPQP